MNVSDIYFRIQPHVLLAIHLLLIVQDSPPLSSLCFLRARELPGWQRHEVGKKRKTKRATSRIKKRYDPHL